MDDLQYETTKLSVLNEQVGYYTRLIEMLQDGIDQMETTKAEYANRKASLQTEAESLERRHYRVE